MTALWAWTFGLLALGALSASPAPRYECDVQPGPPGVVRVYRVAAGVRVPVGPELVHRHPAGMASALDIDGDGRVEVLVLVRKAARYDPEPAWRPFVYTLREGRWAPKWLGSRVGRPLVEAVLVRTPRGARMLTIERFGESKTGLTLYRWRGFGFWGEWTGEPGAPQSELRVSDVDGDGIDEVSVCAGDGRQTFVYRDGGYVVSVGPSADE